MDALDELLEMIRGNTHGAASLVLFALVKTLSAKQGQYLFLNGRWIQDRSLQHALGEAYRGLRTQLYFSTQGRGHQDYREQIKSRSQTELLDSSLGVLTPSSGTYIRKRPVTVSPP